MAALIKYSDTINSSNEFKSVMALGKPQVKYRNNSLASYIPERFLRLANANLQKLEASKRADYSELLKKFVVNDSVFLAYEDSELCTLAKVMADRFSRELYVEHDLKNNISYSAINSKKELVKKHTFASKARTDFDELYKEINARFLRDGFPSLPKPTTSKSSFSILKRLTSQRYWRRLLRTTQSRTLEAEHVQLGHVSRVSGQLYISNESLSRIEKKRIRNSELLESIEAVNEDSYSKSLKDLSSVSTSNPELRRNELMARLRGLEEFADSQGLVGEFYTLTAPSFHHRYSSKYHNHNDSVSVFLNKKYLGITPRDTQAYLNKQWQKIRAELDRRDLPLLGMRVCEPHHDGTPHWHMLFFIKKQHRTEIRQVFRHYALEVNPEEKGAKKHRFTAIRINKKSRNGKPQSAVGYIAKYIAKNLSITRSDNHKGSGHKDINAEFLNDGVPASQSINRVSAWASLWGIRQFQQIGGERITVWRELRRLRNNESDNQYFIPSVFLSAHKAADKGNYSDFLKACLANKKIEIVRKYTVLDGSAVVDDELLQQRNILDESTGELTSSYIHNSFRHSGKPRKLTNVFDDIQQAPIIGLRLLNEFIQTRLNSWKLKQRKISKIYVNEFTRAASAA